MNNTVTIPANSEFSSKLMNITQEMFDLIAELRSTNTEIPSKYIHEVAESVEHSDAFFQSLFDILKAFFTMPLPFSFGLNGNPDFLANLIPPMESKLDFASATGQAGETVSEIFRNTIAPQLGISASGPHPNATLFAVIAASDQHLNGSLMEQASEVFTLGLPLENTLNVIADDVLLRESSLCTESLVGFILDPTLGNSLRLSVWQITPKLANLT